MTNGRGFFSDTVGNLLRRALTRSQLMAAWSKVQSNNGMAGVDGVSVADFGVNTQARLDALRQQVLAGRYTAQPNLRLWLPRPGKSPRPLAVPSILDRVLQTAVAQVLVPLFEAEFEDCSFAYRQGRGVRQAVAQIERLQREGYRWVVDADIESFFDQIPHAPLLRAVGQVIPYDPSVLSLLGHWLVTPVKDGEAFQSPSRGVAQGMPISPLLANLYLDHLDEAMMREDLALVRYADDFVILTRSRAQAEAALELTEHTLAQLQLRLNTYKTRIVHLDDGMEFLGWQFVRSLAVPRNPMDVAIPQRVARMNIPVQENEKANHLNVPLADINLSANSKALEQPCNNNDSLLDIEPEPSALQEPADALQRTLYVVEPGSELGKESERLLVRKADAILLEVPILHVDQVVVFGQHTISAAAMHLCLRQGVPLVLLSRLGRFVGRVDSDSGRHVRLLQAQIHAADDAGLTLALAAQFVAAKLKHSALVLTRFARRHALDPDAAQRLHNTALQLREDRRRVKSVNSLESLRGLEGQAARNYFSALRVILPTRWGFTTRQRQPPPDPINAMLSLGYTLLYQSVAGLLQARGLNAYLGFLHSAGGDHMALASDMMEEFRPVVVDALVLDWCLNAKVSSQDFTVSPEGCTLSRETTRRFIHAYEERMGMASQWAWPTEANGADLRRRIDAQAMRLAQAIHARDAKLYVPSAYR